MSLDQHSVNDHVNRLPIPSGDDVSLVKLFVNSALGSHRKNSLMLDSFTCESVSESDKSSEVYQLKGSSGWQAEAYKMNKVSANFGKTSFYILRADQSDEQALKLFDKIHDNLWGFSNTQLTAHSLRYSHKYEDFQDVINQLKELPDYQVIEYGSNDPNIKESYAVTKGDIELIIHVYNNGTVRSQKGVYWNRPDFDAEVLVEFWTRFLAIAKETN